MGDVGEGNARGEAVDDGGVIYGWVGTTTSNIALHKDPLYTLAHLRRTELCCYARDRRLPWRVKRLTRKLCLVYGLYSA